MLYSYGFHKIGEIFNANWLLLRHKLMHDYFLQMLPNITKENTKYKNTYHRIITQDTTIGNIIDIDFNIYDVIFLSTTLTPSLYIEYNDVTYHTSHEYHEGIVITSNIKFVTTKDYFNYCTFIKIPKSLHTSKFPFVEYPTIMSHEKNKRPNYTYHDNCLIVDNNSNNTLILFIEGGMYYQNFMYNTYYHPYVDVLSKRYQCNIISFRHHSVNELTYHFGITGYPPLTNSMTETHDYIKHILQTVLQTTRMVYTLGWCASVYTALTMGERLESDVFLFDRIITTLALDEYDTHTSGAVANIKYDRKNDIVGTTATIHGLLLNEDSDLPLNNAQNIEHISSNEKAIFTYIDSSALPKRFSNSLDYFISNDMFKKYI